MNAGDSANELTVIYYSSLYASTIAGIQCINGYIVQNIRFTTACMNEATHNDQVHSRQLLDCCGMNMQSLSSVIGSSAARIAETRPKSSSVRLCRIPEIRSRARSATIALIAFTLRDRSDRSAVRALCECAD